MIVTVDDAFWAALQAASPVYTPDTRAADLAVLQYTSGTTRALPEAVKHTHRSVVTLMIAALYGVGLRPGDRYFCPSSPAWGHGLWHGTIAPLALGLHIASYAGKFEARRIFEALEEFQITNMAAAPTVFRLLKNAGGHDRYRLHLDKISFTGEPMDPGTFAYIEAGVWGDAVQHVRDHGSRRADRQFPGFAGVHRQTHRPRQGRPAGTSLLSTALARSCHPTRAVTLRCSGRASGSTSKTGDTAMPRAISTTKAVRTMSSFRLAGP